MIHLFTVKETPSLCRLPITDIQHPNKDHSYVPEKLWQTACLHRQHDVDYPAATMDCTCFHNVSWSTSETAEHCAVEVKNGEEGSGVGNTQYTLSSSMCLRLSVSALPPFQNPTSFFISKKCSQGGVLFSDLAPA